MTHKLEDTVRWIYNSADRLTRLVAKPIPRNKVWLVNMRRESRLHFRHSLSLLWQVYTWRRKGEPCNNKESQEPSDTP
ncbi:MAG: hypothetical protein ABIH46_07145 [Chloroflexota bacterium]